MKIKKSCTSCKEQHYALYNDAYLVYSGHSECTAVHYWLRTIPVLLLLSLHFSIPPELCISYRWKGGGNKERLRFIAAALKSALDPRRGLTFPTDRWVSPIHRTAWKNKPFCILVVYDGFLLESVLASLLSNSGYGTRGKGGLPWVWGILGLPVGH